MARAGDAGDGLEGVTAAASAVSSIAGGTLAYRGISIGELVEHSSFEETAFLLWYGELPAQAELERFEAELAGRRALPPEVLDVISGFPAGAAPMASLRTAVSALGQYDPLAEEMSHEANALKAIGLLAGLPTIVVAIEHGRRGQTPPQPDSSLPATDNFLFMLTGERPSAAASHIMDVALILHADHELNASTFAARVAASTLTDLHSAVVAALCTLKGRLHGGAGEGVFRMIEEVATPENAGPFVRDLLGRGERVMGFGHRVYRQGDPRATWLKEMSQRLAGECGDARWFEITRRIEEAMRTHTDLLPNVDLYSASVYAYLGIAPHLFTSIFAMSRVSGWIAHILEQYENNRLIRPRAAYVGPDRRPYIPLGQR